MRRVWPAFTAESIAARIHPADAAVAEVAAALGKELPRRRAVQIDVVAVREDELELAQRVRGTRALTDAQRASRHAREVVRGRCEDGRILVAAAHDLEALVVQITGAPADR